MLGVPVLFVRGSGGALRAFVNSCAHRGAQVAGVVAGPNYHRGAPAAALASGARREVLFGRNEDGGQGFHGWVERLLALPDAELGGAFAARRTAAGRPAARFGTELA